MKKPKQETVSVAELVDAWLEARRRVDAAFVKVLTQLPPATLLALQADAAAQLARRTR